MPQKKTRINNSQEQITNETLCQVFADQILLKVNIF